MDFGVATVSRGECATREGYLAVAEAAEGLGFGFVSVNDHVVVPRAIASRYPYSESGSGRRGRPANASTSLQHSPSSPAGPSA